ncbi:MAG: tetratricopeptide repeat protein [Vicinamibacteria bacterium]
MKVRVPPSKALALTLFLLTLVSSAALGRGCASETERLLAEAARAEGADDYEGAARRLREIVITHPESPLAAQAQLELAQIYLLRMRDVGAAHAALVKILDDYPASPVAQKAHGLLARLYERELAEPERALLHYRAVLESRPDVETERETLLALGDCHYRLERLEEAAAAYRAAVSLSYDGASDSAYFRLATLSRLSDDLEESLRWLQELVSRTKDPPRLYAALSAQVQVLMELDRFDEAGARLREAERLSPDAPENEELQARLRAARSEGHSFEGENETLEELQKRIRWGSGGRRRER